MPSFHEHVGGDGELEPGIGPQQRTVVADAEQRLFRRPVEEPADDVELVQALVRLFATSSGRSAAAIFSSTPFTKR
jgi:hypothetical protein